MRGMTLLTKRSHDEEDCYELPKKQRVVSQNHKENFDFMAEVGSQFR